MRFAGSFSELSRYAQRASGARGEPGDELRSELVQDLALLHAFKGESEAVDKEELDKALKRLEENELIKTEDRIRGDLGAREEVKDVLISLTDFVATQAALSRDRTLSSYMYEMSRAL